MMNKAALRKISKRAMAMNRVAFSIEEYDIAYHALMVVLHTGQQLSDVAILTEVERLANEQKKYIDAHHPEYTHSTKSAGKRGNSNIFEITAKQARARILLLKQHTRRPLHSNRHLA